MCRFPVLFRILLFVALLPGFHSHCQVTPCRYQVSLLTCSPGDELYTSWGHSALRVVDSAAARDIVYNYGTFDFDDPGFYKKFVRGSLLYFVSVDDYRNFLREYQYYGRGITEQVLNLSCDQQQALIAALENNALEANKYYLYDFLYDNCTTRLRDMVFRQLRDGRATRRLLPGRSVSFRTLIHQYLDSTGNQWSGLGIDILLGSTIDKPASNDQVMFLPDYLMEAFDSTETPHGPLVSAKRPVLMPAQTHFEQPRVDPFWTVTGVSLALALLFLIRPLRRWMGGLDFILFFLCGTLGLLLLYMWLFTNHPQCTWNYNILWAFPPHFIICFFLFRRARWLRTYFLSNAVLLLLVLLLWRWLPQSLNPALIPFIALMAWRCWERSRLAMAVRH